MSGIDALQSVQFVTKDGKRFAVVTAEKWEALIEWLEDVEDIQIARHAFAKLRAAKGSRSKARWRKWSSVEDKLG
jgi:hypothetical protein